MFTKYWMSGSVVFACVHQLQTWRFTQYWVSEVACRFWRVSAKNKG